MTYQEKKYVLVQSFFHDKSNQLQQIGGLNNMILSLLKFIDKSSIQQIKNELINVLTNSEYCDEILGSGSVGKVRVSTIGKTYDIKIGKKIVNIPCVIKESHDDEELGIEIINDDLFIYSDRNIATEAIIMCYIKELYDKEISPHLPLLFGYSKCNKNAKSPVDKIIMERHGLSKKINVNISGYYEGPLRYNDDQYDLYSSTYKTNLATLYDLIKYMCLQKNGNNIILPNSEKCNIILLCDYLTISYLTTHNILQKNNITLTDLCAQNIFIHWLNEKSYMGYQNIQNIKYIYYKYKNKYIKIKTHGLLLKIGDVGHFTINPRQHIYMIGQGINLSKTYKIAKKLSKSQTCHDFLRNFQILLPYNLYQKTVAYKILSQYPYNKINLFSTSYKHMKDMLTPMQMLDYFKKYMVFKIENTSNTLIL